MKISQSPHKCDRRQHIKKRMVMPDTNVQHSGEHHNELLLFQSKYPIKWVRLAAKYTDRDTIHLYRGGEKRILVFNINT